MVINGFKKIDNKKYIYENFIKPKKSIQWQR
jgi:hypothetical protein